MSKYLYENNTKGDLFLPRPTSKGQKAIRVGGRFEGDDSWLNMVGRELRIVQVLAENVPVSAERLLTEQPPVVTSEGKVEFVKDSTAVKMNEHTPTINSEVLLNESPLDGIEMV